MDYLDILETMKPMKATRCSVLFHPRAYMLRGPSSRLGHALKCAPSPFGRQSQHLIPVNNAE